MGIRDLVDPHAASELALTMENDGDLYRQKQSILENLQKKVKKGKYSPAMAPKLWLYWVEAGVRKYGKDNLSGPAEALRMFSPATRRHVAEQFAREAERATVDDGGIGLVSSYSATPASSKPAMAPGTSHG
jgi:hypothetical protein